jgi:hypothetical protein
MMGIRDSIAVELVEYENLKVWQYETFMLGY